MDYQDVLAEIGASNAHPGGSKASKIWRNAITWYPAMHVLDVGCGTGKTLIDICLATDCNGTGIDVRPKMVVKATERARLRGCRNADFRVASVTSLPFPNDSFDVVYSESVNVFLENPVEALSEYWRVLRKGGCYIDVEMLVVQPVDVLWRQGVKQVYGAKVVPDQRGWKQFYKLAGFEETHVLSTQSVDPFDIPAGSPDDVDIETPGVYERPDVQTTLRANGQWMESQHRPLGYGVFRCVK